MAICSVIDSNNSLRSNRFTVALHKNKYTKRLPSGNLFALFFNHDIIKLACFYASKSTFKSIFE